MFDWVQNLFSGGGVKGAEGAQNILNQFGQRLPGYFNTSGLNPYEQTGANALGQYYSGVGAMKDPYQFYQQMMAHYQESPQAKYQVQQGVKAANAAAAAGGMLGSGAEQTALQRQGQDIVAQDQQNWLNNMLGIHSQYLSGMGGLAGQGLQAQGMGLQAQEEQARLAEQLAQQQAQAEWAKRQAQAQGTGGILGAIGSIAGHFLPGFGFGSGSSLV